MSCPYCYAKGTAIESEHVFDKNTHTCICGHKEYQLTIRTEGEGTASAALAASKGETLKSGDYVSSGETISVTATPKGTLKASLTASNTKDNKTETVKPSGSKNNGNALKNTYVMPTSELVLKVIFTGEEPPKEEVIPQVLITFNDGTSAGKTVVLSCDYGEILELPDHTGIPDGENEVKFTDPAGRIFLGWMINDGSKIYYDEGESFTAEEDTTFIAQWAEAYPVWVGGVRISEENAYDVLGNGKVRFYPVTDDAGNITGGTLALSNLESGDLTGTYQDSLIYAERIDLRIQGSGEVVHRDGIDAAKHGIHVHDGGDLTLAGKLNIRAKTSGISAVGTIHIPDSTDRVEVTCSETGNVIAAYSIEIDEALGIKDPVNGSVKTVDSVARIKDAEEKDPRHVLIEPKDHAYITLDWNDNDQTQTRPTSVTVVLRRDEEEIKRVVLDEEHGWSADLEIIPGESDVFYEIDGGNRFVTDEEIATFNERYLVELNSLSDNSFLLVNTLIREPITGKVEWDDQDNFFKKRPEKVTVYLMADGTVVNSQEVTGDENMQWSWSFDDLVQYNEDGNPIAYSVAAAPIEDYTVTSNGSAANGYRITCSYNYVKIIVKKTWNLNDCDDATLLPDRLSLSVLPDGSVERKFEYTLTSANASPNNPSVWTGVVKNGDQYPAKFDGTGKRILYTVRENELSEDFKLTDLRIRESEINLTNTYMPTSSSQIIGIYWFDDDNEDGVRPQTLDITLLKNGTELQTVHMFESEDNTGHDGWWFKAIEGLPLVDDTGKKIEYSWTIDLPDGYEIPEAIGEDGESVSSVFSDGQVTYAVLYHEPELVDITVKKIWDDHDDFAEERPQSVLVRLLADGDVAEAVFLEHIIEDEKEDDGVFDWGYTFYELPKKTRGNEISYTVVEDEVSGYAGSIMKSGTGDQVIFTVTNTYEDSFVISPPETVKDLVYNGEEQALIRRGGAYGGTLVYSLNPGGPYTETIPMGTDAGEYEIYYMVTGDENHEDSDIYGPITVTIEKAKLTEATLEEMLLVYTGKEQIAKVASVKAGMLLVPTEAYTVSGNTATEVGVYTAVITAVENSNFQGQVEVIYYILEEAFTGYYYSSTTGIWWKGSGKDAVYTVRRADLDEYTYELFRYISVDDKIVSPANYEKTRGSIIITLKNSYLETLDFGWHKLTTVFNDGEVATDFLVVPQNYDGRTYPNPYPNITGYTYVNPTNNPRTGDESNISLWVALAVISALTVLSGLTLDLHRRRRKMGNR